MKELDELAEVTRAATEVVVAAHAAVKDLHRTAKEQRAEVRGMVEQAVADEVAQVAVDARAALLTAVDEAVDKLARDLRSRLGLDA